MRLVRIYTCMDIWMQMNSLMRRRLTCAQEAVCRRCGLLFLTASIYLKHSTQLSVLYVKKNRDITRLQKESLTEICLGFSVSSSSWIILTINVYLLRRCHFCTFSENLSFHRKSCIVYKSFGKFLPAFYNSNLWKSNNISKKKFQ